MSGTVAPTRFLAPLIGLMLLFVALGPPIGGALFVPLAVILKPPLAAGALTGSALIAALLGHTIMLIAAYVAGVGPAAATGLFTLSGMRLRPNAGRARSPPQSSAAR